MKDTVAHLTLNRPKKFNSCSTSLLEELKLAFDFINSNFDIDIRCVVLSGNGDHFSAGIDLKDLLDGVSRDPDMDAARSHVRLRKKLDTM